MAYGVPMDSEAPSGEPPAPAPAEDETEQVVGVLKWCDVCGEKTVHIGGVCRDHKITRVRKKRMALVQERAVAATRAPAPVAKKKKPQPKPTSRLRLAIAGILVLGFVVGIGFFHLIHGGGTGVHVCAKTGWSLSDTVVDLDEYGALSHAVRSALVECKLEPAP
jgi:hypothetical protein